LLWAGETGFEIWGWQEFFLLKSSKPTLRPIQTPIECVKVASLPGIKWPGRETNYFTSISCLV
jgi:hypothetical protein